MSQRVPFDVIQTGNSQLDRIQNNVSQAVRQLQQDAQAPQSITVVSSFTLARQTSVIVAPTTTKSVTVSLPNQAPANQTTTVRNQSAYVVHVRTADATTVLADIPPGGSSVLVANGAGWSDA